MIMQACTDLQASRRHHDICHITAQYLVANTLHHKTQIHVRTLKQGRNFTNLSADLIQNGAVTVSAQLIYMSMPDKLDASHPMTLIPPDPMARITPFITKPSTIPELPPLPKMAFKKYFRWYEDPRFLKRNYKKFNQESTENGGVETGWYLDLPDETEGWSLEMLAFASDMMSNLPDLLYPETRRPVPNSWYPTMSLTVSLYPGFSVFYDSYLLCRTISYKSLHFPLALHSKLG